MGVRPLLGISSCLLGENVRYDQVLKRHSWLVEVVGNHVEWLPFCPEVALGLSTPRPAMRLERDAHGKTQMVVIDNGRVVNADQSWPNHLARCLGRLNGYIFKAKSPSCGLQVPVFDRDGHQSGKSDGEFAKRVQSQLGHIPICDEIMLGDELHRFHFFESVFMLSSLHEHVKGGQALAHWVSEYRWSLLLRCEDACQQIEAAGEALAGDEVVAIVEQIICMPLRPDGCDVMKKACLQQGLAVDYEVTSYLELRSILSSGVIKTNEHALSKPFPFEFRRNQ